MNENLQKGIIRLTDDPERKKIKQMLLERMAMRNASALEELRAREGARVNAQQSQIQVNVPQEGGSAATVAECSGTWVEASTPAQVLATASVALLTEAESNA